MFELKDGRKKLYQWDIDRQIKINDPTINQLHFCNRSDDCSLVVDVIEIDGERLANVPNILLQQPWNIRVYGYDSKFTKYENIFKVCGRSKPSDYIYSETEVKTFEQLEKRIDELIENGIEVDLSDYATLDYVDNCIANLDLSGLATKDYVDEMLGVIENGNY